MIIQIIDIYGAPVLEPKCHPPIARNRDRVMALSTAFERVQSKAGYVHSLRPTTSVQCGQDTLELRDVAGRNLRRASAFMECFQATMTERSDHTCSVQCRSTTVNNALIQHGCVKGRAITGPRWLFCFDAVLIRIGSKGNVRGADAGNRQVPKAGH